MSETSSAGRVSLLGAIQIEARNATIYDALAQLFQGYEDSVSAIFREMAAEERQHGADLEQRYRQRFGPVPSDAAEPQAVIEAPDLDDPEAFIFDSMSVEEALAAGLRAELAAREYYRCEMPRTADAELRAVYQELAEFEETHVRLLQDKLAEKRRNTDPTSR